MLGRGAVVGLGVALVLGGCGGASRSSRPLPATPAAASSAPPTMADPTTTGAVATSKPATTSTTIVARPRRPYAVATMSLDLTDPTRSTGGQGGRHLPTLVFYPTSGRAGPAESGGASGLPGPWPVVLFGEGYNVTPLTYHDLLHHLAESGFVVAAPAFPLETQGGPLDENDLQNEPGDFTFVVTQLLAASGRPGALNGLVDSTRIGVVGHSDGAEAALGVAFLPGQSDNRIGPVVSMAGQAILNGDHVVSAPVSHPLLVVQGSDDTINPPQRSDHLYATAPQPKAYLHLLGAGHLPPVADPTPWRPIVERVVVDWLDHAFGGLNGDGASARLGVDGNVGGLAMLTTG